MEYHAIRASNIDYRLSPQWIYDMRTEGRSGMNIQEVQGVLSTYGVAADMYDPAFAVGVEAIVGIGVFSGVTLVTDAGSKVAWAEAAASNAASFKIAASAGVRQLNSVEDVKSALANVGPVIIGVTTFNHSSQLWKPASPTDAELGGHSMVIDGYDDDKPAVPGSELGCFGVRNSWGRYWGDGGFTKMSYSDYNEHVREAWLLTPGFSAAAAPPPLVSPWKAIEPSEPSGDWSAAGGRWAPTALVGVGTQADAMRALLKIDCDSDFVSYNKTSNTYVMGKIPPDAAPATAFKPSATWQTAMAVNLADLSRLSIIRGNVWDRPQPVQG
jgi:hypothetical protein